MSATTPLRGPLVLSTLQPGERVQIKDTRQRGTVASVRKAEVIVQLSKRRVKVDIQALRVIS